MVTCSNKWSGLAPLHTAILKAAGYTIEQSTTKTAEGTFKVTAKIEGKAKIPFLALNRSLVESGEVRVAVRKQMSRRYSQPLCIHRESRERRLHALTLPTRVQGAADLSATASNSGACGRPSGMSSRHPLGIDWVNWLR